MCTLRSLQSCLLQSSYLPLYIGLILVWKCLCIRLDTEFRIDPEDFFYCSGSLRITTH